MFAVCLSLDLGAQTETVQDTLQQVVVSGSHRQSQLKRTAMASEILEKDFLQRHLSGNVVQALENIPGVQSMDIGSGFSKPMIRGLGFSRIAVSENGIKQEGQQWGADHGLEIDSYNINSVEIIKGPASLLYGSDAMGGVIEIHKPDFPASPGLYGDVTLSGKSVNGGFGGSVLLGYSSDRWMVQARFTEQHFGDLHVPTDTVVYLTQFIPLEGRKMKNTAGIERDGSIFAAYRDGAYKATLSMSNAWQKSGFFPGAHGIPDISRLADDGSAYNIELPYSWVDHLKISTGHQYTWESNILTADVGYQYNHREEWSAFHTHYPGQPAPPYDTDKELAFMLHTGSASVRLRHFHSAILEESLGASGGIQHNSIAGYSFLLPEYRRQTAGIFWLATWKPSPRLSVTGGLRYDWGHMTIEEHDDPYLADYLAGQGYGPEQVASFSRVCRQVDRHFGDFSGSVGIVWNPSGDHLFKLNAGRSFRLPGANELSINGVHHGTFRHEQGDPDMDSERGWQVDAMADFNWDGFELELSPFFARYGNYIYLDPTGKWSVLPHAGQIYRYTGTAARFYGGEAEVHLRIWKNLKYGFSGEYVHTFNETTCTALSFSPPATMRNILSWAGGRWGAEAEVQTIARQERIAHNEDSTPGATLLHLGGHLSFPRTGAEISLMVRNLFNTKYYNHLSFYRKVQIPEPGRNVVLTVRIPIKQDKE